MKNTRGFGVAWGQKAPKEINSEISVFMYYFSFVPAIFFFFLLSFSFPIMVQKDSTKNAVCGGRVR